VTDEQRDSVQDMIPFFISGAAAAVMAAVIVLSLFMSPGTQGSERASASGMSHAQHHFVSIR
jgi:outer membrane lipoprotein-sorting protein